MTTRPASLEAFPSAVGLELLGDWITIDPDRASQFYLGTYLDHSYGPTIGAGYDPDLVEGFQVLGLLDWMSSELIGRWFGFNYGLDRVRFVTPITLRDQIRLRLVVREVEARDVEARETGFLVHYDATIEIRGAQRPGMVASWLVLLLPQPAESP